MWVLECEGDLFDHRKTWLRPGRKYLLGRTRIETAPGEQNLVISHKSVSRKHLVIAISPVEPDSSGEPESRSTATIADESKLGTELDGQKFVNESRTLNRKEHRIKLGSFSQILKISWKPVTFTLALPNKPQKGEVDLLGQLQSKLQRFDIKVISPYVIGETTHVIANKRNVPKGLQALINGKYIVTDAYVEAVIAAATSPGVADDGETSLPSPLEQDMVAYWPDAIKFLPASGKEPIIRPAELFEPDPRRIELLERFTFVFADKLQYDSLNSPLTNAGAKTLLYAMQLGITKLSDFVSYTREVAKSKGVRNFADAESEKAVVVVRFRGKGETEKWALDFLRELDGELGQRSVEQNEFLDAILMNDASALKKPLEEAEVLSRLASTAPEMNRSSEVSEATSTSKTSEQTSAQQANHPSHRTRRTIAKSRFKGFDDFDVTSPSTPRRATEIEERPQAEDAGSVEMLSQGLFVSHPASPVAPPSKNKKRPADGEAEAGNEAEMIDELLPAARAMKKRRLEEERAGTVPIAKSVEPERWDDTLEARKGIKKEPMDVRSAARGHAEELDARTRSPSHGNVGELQPSQEEIAAMRNLAIIEEWQPPPRGDGPASRTRSAARHQQPVDTDGRWDNRWNGRKNFKKFRRQGQTSSEIVEAAQRAARVMVPLEEFHRESISESYWLEETPVRHANRSSTSQNSRPAQLPQATRLQSTIHRQQSSSAGGRPLEGEATEIIDSEDDTENRRDIDAQPSASTGRSIGTRRSGNDMTQSSAGTAVSTLKGTQPSSSSSNVAVRGSQAAQSTASGSSMSNTAIYRGSKRPRQQLPRTGISTTSHASANDEDEDDEEHLRFKFRKRD